MNDPELRAELVKATNEYNDSIGATERKMAHSAKLKLKLLIGSCIVEAEIDFLQKVQAAAEVSASTDTQVENASTLSSPVASPPNVVDNRSSSRGVKRARLYASHSNETLLQHIPDSQQVKSFPWKRFRDGNGEIKEKTCTIRLAYWPADVPFGTPSHWQENAREYRRKIMAVLNEITSIVTEHYSSNKNSHSMRNKYNNNSNKYSTRNNNWSSYHDNNNTRALVEHRHLLISLF
ncbi:hypothetical protein BDB00DRAFT_887964 [Zychaea mexicana]|uniref:uncharacterized protein n=1 Tax=Zychaea mexicana TaxID=64656 RepID=UPI0022FDFFFA|nr:uncharacterized protein BDB00DRAFT_887964 [Zychaea mexicana]KAI9496959.1 hypothetical protein BDB00DRAFT_887964 [Zychaea mexicana]